MQKTTVVTEGVRDAEFLESEANGRASREIVVLTLDTDEYVAGTVLMASGDKMVRFDGSADAAGILLQSTDATKQDTEATAIVRLAEVTLADLVFLDAATQAQKDAAVATMATSSLIAR